MREISTTPSITNPLQLFRRIFRGIINGKTLAIRLFIRDIRSEYRSTAFGQIWNFMDPIVYSIIFIILSHGEILSTSSIEIPFPVYVVFGMMIFQTFSQAVLYPFGIYQRSKPLLQEVNVPIESLWMSLLIRQGFDAVFRVLVMIALLAFYGLVTPKGILFFLISFPIIILSGVSIGLLFTPLNGIYDDFSKFAHILMRPLMFISPTFFKDYDSFPLISRFNDFNPLAICMESSRSAAAMGFFSNSNELLMLTLISFLLIGIAIIFFTITINIIAENL